MTVVSYAQNFEDVLLNRVFGGTHYGFYVDIGAYDPVDDSVTKTFYDRGWSGINIEPGDVFGKLAADRARDVNLNMAVYDRSGEISFAQHPGWYGGLSHVQDGAPGELRAPASTPDVEMRMVACDTLTNILHTHANRQPIAFIKIDAEGAELAIVSSTDWRTIRPTVLLIEATVARSTKLDNGDWEPILLQQGYIRAYFDGINCFYVPEERSDLIRHFELPVNVLDGFIRYNADLTDCEARLAAAEHRIQALTAEVVRFSGENLQLHEQNTVLRDQNGVYVGLMHTHIETIAELRRQHDSQIAAAHLAFQTERETVTAQVVAAHAVFQTERETVAAQIAGLQVQLGQREAELDRFNQKQVLLVREAARLHNLMRELRSPNGPVELRAVLPLARIIRRLSGRRATSMLPEEAAIAALSSPQMAGQAPVFAPASRRSLARRLLLLVYAPIRPVARPIAWRSRAFLTSEIRSELARLDEKLQAVLARFAPNAELAQLDEKLQAILTSFAPNGELAQLNDKLQAILARLATAAVQPDWASGEIGSIQSEMRQFGKMLETTLLTLALEHDAPQS